MPSRSSSTVSPESTDSGKRSVGSWSETNASACFSSSHSRSLPLIRASVKRPTSLKPKSSSSSRPRASCAAAGSALVSRYQPLSHTMDGPAP